MQSQRLLVKMVKANGLANKDFAAGKQSFYVGKLFIVLSITTF